MPTIHIEKGILKGLDLEEHTSDQLQRLAEPAHATSLTRGAFYKNKLGRAVYRWVHFSECSFARSVFEHVSFYKCKFTKVDLTRTRFINCFFFGCEFESCDPYYALFENTEVNPASFRNCYRHTGEWNKALVLFSELRRSLLASGDGRLSRKADYYFRMWQRRRLHHLWKRKQMSGFFPWFWSLCLWLLTGYGEHPTYLVFWALGVITAIALIYAKLFPFVITAPKHGYFDFWYFSFLVFFGKGLLTDVKTTSLFVVQLIEFGCGLLLIALLIASVNRKLLP